MGLDYLIAGVILVLLVGYLLYVLVNAQNS